MTTFEYVQSRYTFPDPTVVKDRITEMASHYRERAMSVGYVPLVGAMVSSGLLAVLAQTLDDAGRISEKSLPDPLVEAFRLQFPRMYEQGSLEDLTLDAAQPLLNGWSGKYTEIIVRNRLNSGESIGGIKLDEGEVASLASSANQPNWDLSVEPTGRLLQVKATNDVSYVRETLESLEGTEIGLVATDLPEFTSDSSTALMEINLTKDQIDRFIEGSLSDAIDDLVWMRSSAP